MIICFKCGRHYYKWDNYFITKCDKSLLQNASSCLLQNIKLFIKKCKSFITNYNSPYKMHRFCYKMQQLLQIAILKKYFGTDIQFQNKLSRGPGIYYPSIFTPWGQGMRCHSK